MNVSEGFQNLILKPGRGLADIEKSLNAWTIVSGLLMVAFLAMISLGIKLPVNSPLF